MITEAVPSVKALSSVNFVTLTWLTTNLTYVTDSHDIDFHVPQECIVLQFPDYFPWDNPQSLISLETEMTCYRIKVAIALPVCTLFAFVTNSLNMAVFWKEGLKVRINLCLFTQSLADFLFMLQSVLKYGDQILTQLYDKDRFGPMLYIWHQYHLNGFYGFLWVSQLMSAIIASERCFCIMQPLKSQTVLKTKTMAAIIIVLSSLLIAGNFVTLMKWDVICIFDPVTNSTMMSADSGGEFYFKNQMFVDLLETTVFGAFLPLLFMLIVTFTTVVTGVKLRQVVTWRFKISSSISSKRELALTRMLISTSIFFLFCLSPHFLLNTSRLFRHDLEIGGRNQNLFFFGVSLSEIMWYIFASFHFFVFFYTGSKFRETLWSLFCRRRISESSARSTRLYFKNSTIEMSDSGKRA